MKTIRVKLKENSYDIVIGNGSLSHVGPALKKLKIGSDAVVVTNALIQRLHGAKLAQSLKRSGCNVKVILVPDSETSKSAPVALKVLNEIARHDVRKKVFIVALGGGVVGDLAGFVAAIYKRGVPYIHVPTTLLAQIDSAIGGKVAIDLPVGKNLTGAFYQPKVVWTDVSVLKTLSVRQIRSGLSEAVKYGIIRDGKLFQYIEKNQKRFLVKNLSALMPLIVRCSQIKADVVMSDEKETKGIRTILNFGHTIGHAIEAASHYHYDHGEAVALGMRVAVDISLQLKIIGPQTALRINTLLDDIGLPQKIKKVTLNSVLKIMEHDKKFKAGKNRFVLATQIGQVKVREGIPVPVIRRAVRKYF